MFGNGSFVGLLKKECWNVRGEIFAKEAVFPFFLDDNVLLQECFNSKLTVTMHDALSLPVDEVNCHLLVSENDDKLRLQ